MSTPLSMIAQGSFTSGAVARVIQLPKQPHYFMVKNRTLWGTAPTAVVQSEWFSGMAAGEAKSISEGGASALTAAVTAAGGAGFRLLDLSNQAPSAAIAVTAVTAATPAVASSATTPQIGDTVRLYGTTGMLQIAGMDFTVTAVNPGVTFTLGYLPAVGFAAAATAGWYRILPPPLYTPRHCFVTQITAANPAVITTSVAHGYAAGDRIRIHVPAVFGMPQIDGLLATITAVTASTLTTDIDSSAFTAFAFPTSAVAAAGISFAQVVPAGEIATILTFAERNIGLYAMQLGTAVVGANGNIMDWIAYSRDN